MEESCRSPVAPGMQGCCVTFYSSSSGPLTNGDNQNGPDTGTGGIAAAVFAMLTLLLLCEVLP